MTTLREPPNDRFVTHLRDRYDLSTLVETGTFQAESALWAAERFGRVVTIDISGEFHERARMRCADHRNIEFHIGDTRTVLPDVVATLDRPALFWLDAHAAPGMFGDHDDWPVLEELSAIFASPQQHFILIDDAHCFLPGSPHPACPTYDQVIAIATAGGYECRILADVICVVPNADELDQRAEW
jgi:hypothetical protein